MHKTHCTQLFIELINILHFNFFLKAHHILQKIIINFTNKVLRHRIRDLIIDYTYQKSISVLIIPYRDGNGAKQG